MNCFHPIPLPRPGGRGQADLISVPCGKCIPCLSKNRSQWSFRLEQELKESISAFFVTLTYNDENLKNSLVKRDIQLFLKRLRKASQAAVLNDLPPNHILVSKKEKVSQIALKGPNLRYYLVGEYGTKTFRPHYHLILFNLCKEHSSLIEKSWQMGHVHIGKVTPSSIAYVTKYVITKNEYTWEKEIAPFAMMSLKPGLGSNYLKTTTDYHKNGLISHVTLPGGKKQTMPRYYKNKIFNSYEKEDLLQRGESFALAQEQKNTQAILKQTDNFVEYESKQRKQIIDKFEKSLKNQSL